MSVFRRSLQLLSQGQDLKAAGIAADTHHRQYPAIQPSYANRFLRFFGLRTITPNKQLIHLDLPVFPDLRAMRRLVTAQNTAAVPPGCLAIETIEGALLGSSSRLEGPFEVIDMNEKSVTTENLICYARDGYAVEFETRVIVQIDDLARFLYVPSDVAAYYETKLVKSMMAMVKNVPLDEIKEAIEFLEHAVLHDLDASLSEGGMSVSVVSIVPTMVPYIPRNVLSDALVEANLNGLTQDVEVLENLIMNNTVVHNVEDEMYDVDDDDGEDDSDYYFEPGCFNLAITADDTQTFLPVYYAANHRYDARG